MNRDPSYSLESEQELPADIYTDLGCGTSFCHRVTGPRARTHREVPAAFGRAQDELYTVILGKPL